ncbi:MAG: O-antigen ligase family protein [Gemmatimonadales bacterium]
MARRIAGRNALYRTAPAAVDGALLPVATRHPAPPLAPPASAAEAPAVPGVSALVRWLVGMTIFLSISKFHGYFSILATIRAPLLLSVASLALLFLGPSRWRPGDLGRHWIPRAMGLLTVVAIGSIPFGIYPGQSLKIFNEVLSHTILLAIMVWAVARTPQGVLFLMRALTLSMIGACALALTIGRHDSGGRLAGGYAYDPNDLALIGVTGIPLIVWWALERRNKLRWIILLALPWMFQAIVKSQSRGGFVGLLVMTAGFFLLAIGPVDRRIKRIGLGAGLLVVLLIPTFPADYLSHMKSITADDDYNRTSLTGRKQVWKRGIGYAIERPIFGVGLGNFNSAEGRSQVAQDVQASGRGFKWGTAHNSFVQVIAELGFIGGGCFVFMIFGSIVGLVRLHRRTGRVDLLPPLFAIAFTGFAGSAFFLSWGYYDLTYVLIALSAGILMQSMPGQGANFRTAPAGPPRLRG